jgi:hypothetical protein
MKCKYCNGTGWDYGRKTLIKYGVCGECYGTGKSMLWLGLTKLKARCQGLLDKLTGRKEWLG